MTTKGTTQTESKKDSPYVPVQDYVGQGYSLPSGEQTGAFAKTHRQEIIAQVNKYFKAHYNLEVTTHNLVGAKDAVVAFVESKGDPHFHTSVIVDVDTASQEVTGHVWAYEGDVEGAITSGLYEMAYENEFKNLDRFAESIVKEYPVIGMSNKMMNNTLDGGYGTPYYTISTLEINFPNVYKTYMKNHAITSQDLRDLFEKYPFNKYNVVYSIVFYMAKKHASPDKKIAHEIISSFKRLNGVAPGSYRIFVESNEIVKNSSEARNEVGTIPGKNEIVRKFRN